MNELNWLLSQDLEAGVCAVYEATLCARYFCQAILLLREIFDGDIFTATFCSRHFQLEPCRIFLRSHVGIINLYQRIAYIKSYPDSSSAPCLHLRFNSWRSRGPKNL